MTEDHPKKSAPDAASFWAGLILGVAGSFIYFLWFKDHDLPANFVSELIFWVALLAVSFGAALLVGEEFESTKNENTEKGLVIAVVIGLVITGSFFGAAESINKLALPGLYLVGACLSAFVLGICVWNVRIWRIYGQFAYIVVLTSGIGFTWFARLSGATQGQLIAASFLLGALFYFGFKYIKLGSEDVA